MLLLFVIMVSVGMCGVGIVSHIVTTLHNRRISGWYKGEI